MARWHLSFPWSATPWRPIRFGPSRRLQESLADSRVQALELELALLRRQLVSTQEVLDRFRTSFEVEPELVDAFWHWKGENPIPAQPLVSVCVATYNRVQLLTERCIPSILSQAYPRFEVIVVGHACSDETAARMAEIRDPRLTFENLPRRTPPSADPVRQWWLAGRDPIVRALELARGDYITHLDDDDEYLPHRLEKLVDSAVEAQADLLWHPFWGEEADGKWTLRECPELTHGNVTTSSIFYRRWFVPVVTAFPAHGTIEPGDWHCVRKMKFFNPVCRRHPEPLLRHYREGTQLPGQLRHIADPRWKT